MTKRRLSNRELLRKLLKEAEPASTLSIELTAIQNSLKSPPSRITGELITLLNSTTHQAAKHLIADFLGANKEERAIEPLMRAATASENTGYSANFLWPLLKYDCTKYLKFFTNFIVSLPDPGEAMMVAVMIIREMKGPFESSIARRCVRKLLAEVKTPTEAEWKLQTEAFRLEAADFVMAKYFNQMRQAYWKPRNGSVWVSKTH